MEEKRSSLSQKLADVRKKGHKAIGLAAMLGACASVPAISHAQSYNELNEEISYSARDNVYRHNQYLAPELSRDQFNSLMDNHNPFRSYTPGMRHAVYGSRSMYDINTPDAPIFGHGDYAYEPRLPEPITAPGLDKRLDIAAAFSDAPLITPSFIHHPHNEAFRNLIAVEVFQPIYERMTNGGQLAPQHSPEPAAWGIDNLHPSNIPEGYNQMATRTPLPQDDPRFSSNQYVVTPRMLAMIDFGRSQEQIEQIDEAMQRAQLSDNRVVRWAQKKMDRPQEANAEVRELYNQSAHQGAFYQLLAVMPEQPGRNAYIRSVLEETGLKAIVLDDKGNLLPPRKGMERYANTFESAVNMMIEPLAVASLRDGYSIFDDFGEVGEVLQNNGLTIFQTYEKLHNGHEYTGTIVEVGAVRNYDWQAPNYYTEPTDLYVPHQHQQRGSQAPKNGDMMDMDW